MICPYCNTENAQEISNVFKGDTFIGGSYIQSLLLEPPKPNNRVFYLSIYFLLSIVFFKSSLFINSITKNLFNLYNPLLGFSNFVETIPILKYTTSTFFYFFISFFIPFVIVKRLYLKNQEEHTTKLNNWKNQWYCTCCHSTFITK